MEGNRVTPSEAREIELEAREEVEQSLGSYFRVRGITVEDVRIEGEYPRTEVVIVFTSVDHPDVVFARAVPVWLEDGEYCDLASVAAVNLEEHIVACGHGLPRQPEPDGPGGLVWF